MLLSTLFWSLQGSYNKLLQDDCNPAWHWLGLVTWNSAGHTWEWEQQHHSWNWAVYVIQLKDCHHWPSNCNTWWTLSTDKASKRLKVRMAKAWLSTRLILTDEMPQIRIVSLSLSAAVFVIAGAKSNPIFTLNKLVAIEVIARLTP